MKHKKNIAHICLLALFFLVIVMPSLMAQEASLSRYLPAKALVYLESNNLSGQLEKLLKSDFANNFEGTQAYDDFTRSKLYNKLEDRITNLENATGFGINLENLQALAGSNSAFALYDIGEVKFVFITEIGEAKVTASNLWSLKDKFETRKAESLGKDYWVKEEDGGRVSFALPSITVFL